MASLIQGLLSFLDSSPTAWHAVEAIVSKLKEAGFQELLEQENWPLKKGGKYYVIRDGSAISAFIMPKSEPLSVNLLASHLDSPSLKLKPEPEIRRHNMILLGSEVYGSPLLTSWLNRDLGIAGRVLYYDSNHQIKESLINLTDHPVIIPQLAIHLDREVNEKGLLLNKQEHLNALAALERDIPPGSYFETLLRTQIDFEEILSFDLFLYPLEKARLVGYNREMISSYRIDSLASVHASLEALLGNSEPTENAVKMVVFWNHEEVGSNTTQGAASPFLSQTLERIVISSDLNKEHYFRLLSRSTCVSIDLAHALNPNYAERHDARHLPILGKGVILKANAQQRYATDAKTSLGIKVAAKKQQLYLQNFVSRNDIPSGSTIGPIHAGVSGMSTVDIGCGQLSMHSSREIISCQDHQNLYELLKECLEIDFGWKN